MEHLNKLRARLETDDVSLNNDALFILLHDTVQKFPIPKDIVNNRKTSKLHEWVAHVALSANGMVKTFAVKLNDVLNSGQWVEDIWDDLQPLLLMFM